MTKAPTPADMSKGQSDNTNSATKSSITQRLRTDLGRSVGVTTATQLELKTKLCLKWPVCDDEKQGSCQQRTLTPSGHLVLSHLHLFIQPKPHYLLVALSEHDLLTEFYITELERFQQNICNGWGMLAGDADSSGHLVLSHFGTCMCSNVVTNLSWTCRLVSGLLSFEHPSVLLFCSSYHNDLDRILCWNDKKMYILWFLEFSCSCSWFFLSDIMDHKTLPVHEVKW